MQTIREFTTVLVLLAVTLCLFNGCSDPTQKLAAAEMTTSEADLQSNQREFENAMEAKIAAFRQSLDEMKALGDNASAKTKVEIVLHTADLERQLKAVETGLADLKAKRTSNQAWRSAMEL